MVDRIRIRNYGYDSTTGLWTRDVKGNQISSLNVVDSTPAAGATTALTGSIVIPANTVGFLTGVAVAADAVCHYEIQSADGGSNTTRRILPLHLNNNSQNISATQDAPLAVFPASSTITQRIGGGGSAVVSAAIMVTIIPNSNILETE